VAVAAVALSTGTSVAAAHGGPPSVGARCNALEKAVNHLTAWQQKLSDALAAVEQKMAGPLTPRQQKAVERELNWLTRQYELVDKLLVKAQALHDRLCGGTSPSAPQSAPSFGA
jgi:hypothetical protein